MLKELSLNPELFPKSAPRAIVDDDIYLWDEHFASWSRVTEHSRQLLLDPDSGKL
jgi:hypothetical protein